MSTCIKLLFFYFPFIFFTGGLYLKALEEAFPMTNVRSVTEWFLTVQMEYEDGAIVPAQAIPLCIWIQTVVGDFTVWYLKWMMTIRERELNLSLKNNKQDKGSTDFLPVFTHCSHIFSLYIHKKHSRRGKSLLRVPQIFCHIFVAQDVCATEITLEGIL